MIVYGSGIGDGNAHNHDDLPILLAGRGGGTIKSGRHVRSKRKRRSTTCSSRCSTSRSTAAPGSAVCGCPTEPGLVSRTGIPSGSTVTPPREPAVDHVAVQRERERNVR